MRTARLIACYFAIVLVGGALLAPWLHQLMQWLAGSTPMFEPLAAEKFHRYVTRSWLVIGLLGLKPLLSALGLRSKEQIGLQKPPSASPGVAAGLMLGFATLALAAFVSTSLGPRTFNTHHLASDWLKHLLNASLAALVVSFTEELFFRGVLFGGLRQSMKWQSALLISSAIYAIVHFFERSVHEGEVAWWSGLALLPRMLRGFGDMEALVPGFLNLLVAGGLLGLAYQRTASLWFSIGLHAGWIFWLKSYGYITQGQLSDKTWLWGSGKLIDGWICLPLLLALVPLVNRSPASSGTTTTTERA